jgi:glucokinase
VRYAKEAAATDPAGAGRLLQLVSGDLGAITGPMVTEAARAGDSAAIDAFARIGTWLAFGLTDLIQILDPQVIVVGGGVVDAGDLLMAPTRAALTNQLAQRGKLPVAPVRAASMGNDAGVVGAADLARRL